MAAKGFQWLPGRWFKKRPATPAAREREVNAALRSALFAFLDRDYPVAEEFLSDAVRADSDSIDAYLALARFYRDRGEVGRAIRVHQNLLLRRDLGSERRVVVLTELARDFERGGFLSRAIASYEEVLAHESKNALALTALTDLFAATREYPKAISMSKRLARALRRKDPEREARLWVESSEVAHSEGRGDDARKAARMAIRRDANCARAYMVLGQVEAERGRDKAALTAWRKAPDLDPDLAVEVYSRIEAAFASLGRAREYEEYLRERVEKNSSDTGVALVLVRYLKSRGDHDLALAELKRVLDREPGNLPARAVRGRLLLASHRDDEALTEYAALLDVLEEGAGPATTGVAEARRARGEMLE